MYFLIQVLCLITYVLLLTFGKPYLLVNAMPQPAAAAILSSADRLVAVYRLKIHLLGISLKWSSGNGQREVLTSAAHD